jgi:hypothetical protein
MPLCEYANLEWLPSMYNLEHHPDCQTRKTDDTEQEAFQRLSVGIVHAIQTISAVHDECQLYIGDSLGNLKPTGLPVTCKIARTPIGGTFTVNGKILSYNATPEEIDAALTTFICFFCGPHD